MSQSTHSRRARELRRKGEIRQNTWIRLPHGTIMNPEAVIYVNGKANRSDLANIRAERKKLRKQMMNQRIWDGIFGARDLMDHESTIDDLKFTEDWSGFYRDDEFDPEFYFKTGNSEFDEWYYEFVVKQRKKGI